MRVHRSLALLVAFAGVCGLALVPRARAAEPLPEVVVRAGEPEGRLLSDSVTNASMDAIYAQTTSPLADAAFSWVRATNALSYVRCYNWLGDGMPKNNPNWFSGCRVAKKGPNGEPVYQWDSLERVLDTLVASGVKPMIVCGGVPDALAAGPIRRNEGGAAANRPADYARYQDMIAQMVRRLEKTYGAEEVRSWYFEAWSQPDHEGSWEGGRPAPFQEDTTAAMAEPFHRLYDHFVAGALSVDDKVRVGGPGLAGDVSFFRRFLEHCVRGTSFATGKPGTRVDFLSWQRYGTVPDIVRWNSELRGIVEQDFPALKGVQYVLSECGSGSVEGARSSSAYEAARMAALLDANARSPRPVDFIFRSGDLIDDHFNGYRSLITQIGNNTLPLPAFRLYMMLSKMGGERLKTETPAGVGAIATRSSVKAQRNATQVLLYRYDPSVLPGTGQPITVKVKIGGLPANLLRLPMRQYRVDEATNSPYEAWLALGKPAPAPEGIGRSLLGPDPFKPTEEEPGLALDGGAATLEVKLAPNSVTLVTLGAEAAYDSDLCARGQRIRRAEDDLGAVADLEENGRFEKAIDALRAIQKKYADTYFRQSALYALVGVYELDLKSPDQAEAVRRELLASPIDDLVRLGLLQRVRVDMVRKGDQKAVDEFTREIDALVASFKEQQKWPLKRFRGS
ncbi:MAG: beta-xylosidase [Armatimonadetes bacterium]|jgi:xylan 1,4-beta-xylosidase|nr:beta-xylosidase [Armatimonadota bacterium]